MFIPDEKAENNIIYLRLDLIHSLCETIYEELEANNDEFVTENAATLLRKAALVYGDIIKRKEII